MAVMGGWLRPPSSHLAVCLRYVVQGSAASLIDRKHPNGEIE